jgi:hypothetical protein
MPLQKQAKELSKVVGSFIDPLPAKEMLRAVMVQSDGQL